MFRPRIIPILLLKGRGLVKSIKFKNQRYIGDPINAVKIFNDLKADELGFLDILASREGRTISLDFVRDVGEEANMPFAVGGGIRTIEDIRAILSAGAEKVVMNTVVARNPDFVSQAADSFGSSTIVVCMDVKKRRFFGKEQVWYLNGQNQAGYPPVEFAQLMEQKGVGELIVQSIDQDGMMNGYDLDLIRKISEAVTIPVVALGGAGSLKDMRDAHKLAHANGLAAGSMFVYHSARKGVLINYPDRAEFIKGLA
jgi:imidazole glycerol-phosphate synthase subunit HisF